MPAVIVVVTGPAAGSEFSIVTRVVRIGGSGTCDVPLDGLPDECLQVEFGGEGYLAVNRSDLTFMLEGEPLPPGGVMEWHAGEDLEWSARGIAYGWRSRATQRLRREAKRAAN